MPIHPDASTFAYTHGQNENGGMRQRDFVAVQALTGILAGWEAGHKIDPAKVSKLAYELADAMIAQSQAGRA
jgi:hypothetical protein